MHKLYLSIFLFLVSSCKNFDNEKAYDYKGIDYAFLDNYQNCIAIITHYKMGDGKISSNELIQALLCLRAITDIEHNIHLGDIVVYTSEDDYYRDLNAWSNWYSKNKDFTIQKADQKLEEFSKKYDQEVSWLPMITDIIIQYE